MNLRVIEQTWESGDERFAVELDIGSDSGAWCVIRTFAERDPAEDFATAYMKGPRVLTAIRRDAA